MRPLICLLAALAIVTAACANPLADDPVEAGPSRELAETPDPLAELEGEGVPSPDVSPEPSGGDKEGAGNGDGPGEDGSAGDGGNGGNGGNGGGDGGDDPEPGGGATASISDRAGDHGLRAPDYADVRGVQLQDLGAALRLTLEMNGEIPARLPDDEVQGVGIDLYRPNAEESAYQVFIDGSADGWFAYFSTPRGFKEYPGRFGLGGNLMVFEVPWSAMKLDGDFTFSAFCDWTQRTTGVVNLFGEDHAPDRGTAAFRRS